MHENEKSIRDGYEAMARGDGSVLASLLTPSTEWIIHGEGELAGTHTGPDENFDFWKLVARKTGGGLRLELLDVLANDERALALVRGERGAGESSARRAEVVVSELDGGAVTSASFVYERPDVDDAFWD